MLLKPRYLGKTTSLPLVMDASFLVTLGLERLLREG